MKNPEPIQTLAVVVKVPKLLHGDDKAVAAELTRRFVKAQRGMIEIMALAIYASEIKDTQLIHGQWGPWLAAHAPKLCRKHSVSGCLQPSHALEGYITMARAVLESQKLTVKQYAELVSKSPHGGICAGGKLLTLPESKVPEPLRALRNFIRDSVDGKTQRQVLMEFKQMEEDETGERKKKHGRLKGQGGASAAQRAAAKAALLEAEAQSANEWAEETGATIRELADDAHWGKTLTDANAEKLLEDLQTGADYLKQLVKARSKAKA